MKKRFINILSIAAIITTIGFIMDGDVKEPSMAMRFLEFFLMLTILFILTFVLYSAYSFAKRKLQKA